MDRDTEAFNVVSDAFSMPKETDEQKAARSAAIQEGLKGCTKTPMEMMELCADGIALAASLQERGFNDTSASDLGVAFLSLKSGLQGAWLNVLINVGSIKDAAFAGDYRVVDFMLSNMVNAGVTDVGVIMQRNYHSLMDHIGSGKEWDLHTRNNGLFRSQSLPEPR